MVTLSGNSPEWLANDPPLYAHQRRILRRLVDLRGICAVFGEPGVGKTRPVLAYASMLAHAASRPTRVLVIAPPAALSGWIEQAVAYTPAGLDLWAEALGGSIRQRAETMTARGRWEGDDGRVPTGWRRAEALEARRDGAQIDPREWSPNTTPSLILLVVSTSTLSSRQQQRSQTMADVVLAAVKTLRPDLLVCDESHLLRGVASNSGRLARRVARHIPRRVLMTGTPTPAGPLDLWGQWQVLDPDTFATVRPDGTRKPWSFGAFRHRYADMGGWMGRQVVGYRDLDDLRARVGARSIAIRKADVLDLPPIIDVPVHVTLSPAERRAYDEMTSGLAAQLADGSLAVAANRLTQMMRLRQITSGFLHDTATDHTEEYGRTKRRAATSLITSTLAGEDRVVLFAHFRREVDGVADDLRRARHDRPTTVEVISGDTPADERLAIRHRFGDRAGHPERVVLVCQMRTMSLAINELVTARHAVYLSLSERREDLVQSRDRLHRIGQDGDRVTYWTVTAPGTVDDVILRAHLHRADLEEALMRHLREKTSRRG